MPTEPGFSKRLQIAIAKAGIRKGDLARAVGLTPNSLSRYLRGDRVPHRAVLIALAETLKVAPSYLLGTDAAPRPLADTPVAREVLSPYPHDAVSLAGLDVEERRTMIRMLDALRSGDAEIRRHLIGQLKIIEVALQSRRQQPRAEKEDAQ